MKHVLLTLNLDQLSRFINSKLQTKHLIRPFLWNWIRPRISNTEHLEPFNKITSIDTLTYILNTLHNQGLRGTVFIIGGYLWVLSSDPPAKANGGFPKQETFIM